ncbi:hypothetical protein [Bacillus sp. SM2101]|nr:hypothetical protein [Bacillus sp. SM2101]
MRLDPSGKFNTHNGKIADWEITKEKKKTIYLSDSRWALIIAAF